MKKPWSWKSINLSCDLFGKLEQDFEIEFYKKALEYDPENVDILVSLGDIFAKRGLVRDGLDIDKRLVRVCPNEPSFFYNLACSHSLLNELDFALEALEKAIQLGYQNFKLIQSDSDLDNLRKDRRFNNLLKNLTSQRS